MAKKRKIPKHIQDEINRQPIKASDFDAIKPLYSKALALGVIAGSTRAYYPTVKGHLLLSVLPKPSPWFNTNDERVALLVYAMNGFEYPFEDD